MGLANNDWSEITLANLGDLARGKSKHRPRNDPRLFGGTYPFIQTSDIKHANYYVNSYSNTYNETGLAQSKLWPKDTLCITIAANIAETALLSFPACFPDSVVGFIENPEKSDVRFIKYSLDYYKKRYQQRSQGAAQDNLSLEKIESLKLRVPRVPIQRKIAEIISAYDKLIENNEKRIKILEEMAQRLYTEWFVKFNFPGYEKVKMINSPLGKFPDGWEVKRIDEVARVIRGTSYSSEQISDSEGEFYIVNLKSFNRGGGFRFDGVKYFNGSVKENQLLKQGDIVVAVTDMTTDRAVISRPARIPNIKSDKVTFSADVVKIVPEKLPFAYAYYSLLDYRFTETTKNKANGANVLHLKPQAISEYKIFVPTNNLLEKFENAFENSVRLTDILSEESEKLTKMRDLLIPQLVTGRKELKG